MAIVDDFAPRFSASLVHRDALSTRDQIGWNCGYRTPLKGALVVRSGRASIGVHLCGGVIKRELRLK